jgi:hypothetical protein
MMENQMGKNKQVSQQDYSESQKHPLLYYKEVWQSDLSRNSAKR